MRRPFLLILSLLLLATLANSDLYPAPVGQNAKAAPRLDTLGRPLPQGAIARLGGNKHGPCGVFYGCKVLNGGAQFCFHEMSTIEIWDAKLWKKIRSIPVAHEARPCVMSSAVAPNSEFLLVCTAGDFELDEAGRPKKEPARQLEIVDLRSESSKPIVIECANLFWSLAILPSQREFIGLTRDGWCVCSLSDGRVQRRVPIEQGITSFVYLSPDGRLLFAQQTGIRDQKPRLLLFDVAKGELLKTLDCLGTITDTLVKFSPDGKYYAIEDEERIKLFDSKTHEPQSLTLKSDLKPGSYWVGSMAFSPDSRHFAVGINDVGIHIWKLGDEKVQVVSPPLGYGTVFFADDRTIVISQVRSAHKFDIVTGKFLDGIPAHEEEVVDVTFSRDDHCIWTIDRDSLCRWNRSTFQVESRRDFDAHLTRFCEGNQSIFKWRREHDKPDLIYSLIDIQTGKERDLSIPNPSYSTLLAPDGKIFVTNDTKKDTWNCFTLSSNKHLSSIPHDSSFDLPAFFPDSRKLIVNTRLPGVIDHGLRVFDVHTGACLHDWRWTKKDAGHIGIATSGAVVTADGRRVLALQDFGAVLRTIDAKTGESVDEWEVAKAGIHPLMRVSPDRQWLAVMTRDYGSNSLSIYSARTLRFVAEWKVPDNHPPQMQMEFSPDSTLLVTTGQTALVWDIAALRQPPPNIPLNAEKREMLWDDLKADAKTAYSAIGRWIEARDAAIEFFAQQMSPVPVAAMKNIDDLLAQLDDADYAVREKASRELEALGSLAHAAIEQFLTKNPPTEARQRAEKVRARLEKGSRREDRVVETLECIGTEPAQELLRQWAKGDPAASLTIQAKASLERLERRKW